MRIETVCAVAGYSRGPFYSQFDSIEELVLAACDGVRAQFISVGAVQAATRARLGELLHVVIDSK